MPYIEPKDRLKFSPVLSKINKLFQQDITAGDLNFLITKILHNYAQVNKYRYLTFCTVMGTLICVAFEFYRRVVSPYEDEKIKENGDV